MNSLLLNKQHISKSMGTRHAARWSPEYFVEELVQGNAFLCAPSPV
jgi:hypothetical protein